MMDDNLERDLRAIYGAYEFLRAHDLSAVSTTSRLLHEANLGALAGRVRDELDELAGTIAGTHGHGGGRDDVVLEAYQTIYWLIVFAVADGQNYDDVAPHEHLTRDHAPDPATPIAWSGVPESASPRQRRQAIQDGLALVGGLCRAAGIPVEDAVRRDAAELRARSYLAPYWARHDAS